MDIHAHMFKTEVVGLLGGECLPDSSYIRIKSAVPCRSISTRIQCEMDAGKFSLLTDSYLFRFCILCLIYFCLWVKLK